MAIITAALGFYFTSGFVYNKPAPSKTIFFYFLSIFFCSIAIADAPSLMPKLFFASLIAMNTFYSFMLIRNLREKPAKAKLD